MLSSSCPSQSPGREPRHGISKSQGENLDAPIKPEPTLEQRVRQVIDTIRPALQMDGGDCKIVAITEDGTVNLRLQGACGGCASASMTLHNGIERRLKSAVPEIKRVVSV